MAQFFVSRSEVQEFELVNSDLTLKKSLKSYHLSLSPLKEIFKSLAALFARLSSN